MKSAVSSIQWMITNAPQWNTKVYIDGVTIYDKLADAETDPARKKILVDSLLLLHDLRIKNCGDEINVLNRKAYASYKYNIKNKEELANLLALYDKVFTISGNNVTDGNLVAYMTTVKANRVYLKTITDDQIIERYDRIITVADTKIASAKTPADADKLRGYKDAVDALLMGMVKVDCDFVKKNLAPKFKQNPNDLTLAKKIFKFMLEGKCTDAGLLPNPDRDYRSHTFVGVDYDLNVDSYASPETFDQVLADRLALIQSAVTLQVDNVDGDQVEGDQFEAAVTVGNNLLGHNFPTGFAFARQFWLEVTAQTADGTEVCLVDFDGLGPQSACGSGQIDGQTQDLPQCDPLVAADALGLDPAEFSNSNILLAGPQEDCDPWLANFQRILLQNHRRGRPGRIHRSPASRGQGGEDAEFHGPAGDTAARIWSCAIARNCTGA